MSVTIRRWFSWSIDASTTMGKFTLPILLAVLAYLFNWEDVLTTPYVHVRSHLQSWDTFYSNPFIANKIAHPFEPLDLQADVTGHFEKIGFRFMPFLIANVLHFDQRGLICLQMLLGITFPLLVWKLLFDVTKSAALSTCGVVLVCGLYLGISFFFDAVFFDSFAYFFLLCAMLRLPRWMSFAFLICAGFTDERAVLAACFVSIWRLFAGPDATVKRATEEALWLLAFLVSYALLRVAIGSITGLGIGHRAVGFEILRLNLPNIVLLVWSVFEGGWLIVVLAAFHVWDSQSVLQRVLAGVSAVCLGCIFLAGLLVGDSIRSHQYAFPLLLIAIVVAGRQPSAIPPRVMKLAIALTLATPITIYLGMESLGGRTIYNLYPLRPGYLEMFGL